MWEHASKEIPPKAANQQEEMMMICKTNALSATMPNLCNRIASW